jgi:hypothetical protein
MTTDFFVNCSTRLFQEDKTNAQDAAQFKTTHFLDKALLASKV